MRNQSKKSGAKTKIDICLVLIIVVFCGCASYRAADGWASGSKRITNISVSEGLESLILTIDGDQTLTYKTEKLVFPMGVVLQFPDTRLELPGSVYSPPENEIISSIKADENIEDQTKTARIFIAFKKDTLYDLTSEAGRIKLTFPKAGAIAEDARSISQPTQKQSEPEKKSEPGTTEYRQPAANYLTAVTATPLEDKITVEVKADGAISDYKSFTLDNPPRIVFDLYHLKSPYQKEQIISVASKWVTRIRHFAHPDRLRLVLETHKGYLSKYVAVPRDTGLLIYVGNTDNHSSQSAPDNAPGAHQAKLAWEPVPGATAYNVYWHTSPGVTRHNGNKISNVQIPAVIKNLRSGITYYFVVTAVKGSSESAESEEISYTPGE